MAGVRVCAGGRWTECSGGLDPIPEQGTLACNGSDDDCDGCTDGTWSPDGVCEPSGQPIYDILFINDVSGSMTNNNEIVRAAVTKFSGRLAGWEYMWALASLSAGPRGSAVLIQNLTDLTSFTVALGFLSTSGSLEPSWDAVYEAASGELGVSWRPGSIRIIILFTDEEGQSVRSPVIREAEMCASLINGETFIAVVPDEHREDFDDCAVWVNLPDVEAIISSSLSAGSGERCLSFDDCFPDEGDAICFDGTCVSQPVVDMVNSFNRVIIDPCAR